MKKKINIYSYIYMALKYKYKKKKTFKKKTTFKPKVYKSLANKMSIHHFKRWTNTYSGLQTTGTLLTDGNGTFVGAYDTDRFLSAIFRLQDLPGYTDFTNMYDQYRINKVVLKLFNCCNVNQFQPNGVGTTPPSVVTRPIGHVIDYDDKTLATSNGVLDEYTKCKYTRFPKDVSITLTPACQSVVSKDDTGANLAASIPKFKQWISTESPEIEHYGVKMYIPSIGAPVGNTNTVYRYQYKVCYYISCKNVK